MESACVNVTIKCWLTAEGGRSVVNFLGGNGAHTYMLVENIRPIYPVGDNIRGILTSPLSPFACPQLAEMNLAAFYLVIDTGLEKSIAPHLYHNYAWM